MKKSYLGLILSLGLVGVQLDAVAQHNGIQGKLKNKSGEPIEAATITVKELGKSTSTNSDGSFTFSKLPDGVYTIIVKSLGNVIDEETVKVVNGSSHHLSLVGDINESQLDQVEVHGYNSHNNKTVYIGKSGILDKDLPQSVQIINEQVIADQQVNRLSDALKNANGVAMGANRGGVNETFYARGYSLGANNIFKNGARTNNGGSIEASTLESVEILKGSSALLYGGVSGGAVVNLVTKKPKFEYGGEASMRVGSYDFYKPTVDVYGPISDKVAFRVIGTYEKAGSFRDHVNSKRLYVNPSVLYKISDRTDLNFVFDYLKSDFTPDFGIGSVDGKLNKGVGRNTFLNTVWAYNNTNSTNGQINLNHKFNDNWKLNAIASSQSYDRDYYGSDRIQANANGIAARNLTRSKSEELSFNQQLNLTGEVKTGHIKHKILIGADADQSNTKAYAYTIDNSLNMRTVTYDKTGAPVITPGAVYDNINVFDIGSTVYTYIPSHFENNLANPKVPVPEVTKTGARTDMPGADYLTRTTTNIYRYGVFVQDLVELTEQFKVLAGLRYTYQRTPYGKKYTYATDVTEDVKNVDINKNELGAKVDQAWSPKFGLIYQPIPTSSIYVTYANNFTSNSGYDVNYQPMGPSTIDQYEAGVKNDFFNGRLTANVAWYRINNNKFAQQLLVKPDGTDNGDTNMKKFTGKTASDGVEIDVTGSLFPGLDILAGYSYNYMRYTETSPITKITTVVDGTPKVTEVSGNQEDVRLVGTTAHTANGTIFYTLQNGGAKGLKLGVSAFYTGRRNAGWNNTKINERDGVDRLITVSPFTTVDLSAGYAFKNWSILAKMSNINNAFNYYIHENYSVNPIPPRSFMTTLTYKF
ncbi:TonB-dependent receptor [Sphingobacterium sp. SRCM116780]|uniref:TonB-dependent receptor n=1 Tax=Sphingobacterium sp. SRCM116780 TaxID=2907623 RepID=UPI001F1BE19D|nr:TonB-dependent receptor [Sphingobacterium sp. SRCM116780]UIR57951.1 TonB-dependent receptor [Sphingobacterium sp. SRCM116780]